MMMIVVDVAWLGNDHSQMMDELQEEEEEEDEVRMMVMMILTGWTHGYSFLKLDCR
jgi:hypothetical protein